MTKEEFMELHPDYKVYEFEGGRIIAHPRSCFFCKHLTDIFSDSSGPYMFMCKQATDEEDPTDAGLRGECEMFEKENEDA